jgi:hypothetical protein
LLTMRKFWGRTRGLCLARLWLLQVIFSESYIATCIVVQWWWSRWSPTVQEVPSPSTVICSPNLQLLKFSLIWICFFFWSK